MKQKYRSSLLVLLLGCALAISAFSPNPPKRPKDTKTTGSKNTKVKAKATKKATAQKPSTPSPEKSKSTRLLIKGGTLWTATGKIIKGGDLLIENGKIKAVGKNLEAQGAKIIQAKGKHVTPGVIDTHSHMGVYASPHVRATADGNEMTRPVTAYAWAEHAFWPRDSALPKALEGGVTTIQVLPGSGNLIGGRSVVLKMRIHARSVQEMKFPGAKHGLKMACGENPKRVHRSIMSRMGNVAGYRRAYQRAKEYRARWQRYEKKLKKWKEKKAKWDKAQKEAKAQKAKASKAKAAAPKTQDASKGSTSKKAEKPKAKKPKKKSKKNKKPGPKPHPPRKDINLESLKKVLDGEILVHIHCYRADEMLQMIQLSREFGFKIRSFHHAVEAYKIRDVLAKENIAPSVWPDWWGFKLEAYDGIQESPAMLAAAGVKTVIHSDSANTIQRLNQESAKAYYRGKAMGLKFAPDEAIQWITINPAWALGIHKQTGSLEVGKMADITIWNRSPLSVYTRTHMVLIDGKIVYQRGKPSYVSDFLLGQSAIQPLPKK